MSYLVGTTEDDINENDIDFEKLENLDTTSIIDRLRGLASYIMISLVEDHLKENEHLKLLLKGKLIARSLFY